MHLNNWSLLFPDRRTPVLTPAYDFVATLPYLPDDKLALNFGKSRSLGAITIEQVRRFADTAGLPANPVWQIVTETAERTVSAWETLDERHILSPDMQALIGKHIVTFARAVRHNRT